MDTLLPGLWSLSPIGAVIGMLVLAYWMLATGRLLTKSAHEREMGMANKRGDEWKETALETRSVNAEIRKQNGQLVEANRIVESFLRAASPGSLADTTTQRTPDVVA